MISPKVYQKWKCNSFGVLQNLCTLISCGLDFTFTRVCYIKENGDHGESNVEIVHGTDVCTFYGTVGA